MIAVLRDIAVVGVVLWMLAIAVASLSVASLSSARLGLRFAGFQLLSMAVTVTGWVLLLPLAYLDVTRYDKATQQWHWPRVFWPWDNDIDGLCPEWWQRAHPSWSQERLMYVWAAWRNPAENVGAIRGARLPGGPIVLKQFAIRGKLFYAKAGWQGSTGQIVMSAGAGRGW